MDVPPLLLDLPPIFRMSLPSSECPPIFVVAGIGTAIVCGIVPMFADFLKFKVVVALCEWFFRFQLELTRRRAHDLSSQSLGLAASSVSDVLITITLVYHLVRLFLFAAKDCVLIRAASTQDRLHVYRLARRPHHPTYVSSLAHVLSTLLT